MEFAEHAAAAATAGAALADALDAGPLDVPVPTCPDWTLADLAVHVGEFAGFGTHVLCEGLGRPKTPFPDPPPPASLPGWYRELDAHLREVLAVTPPDAPMWTWVQSDQSAGFIARRCAHELAVHCFDAQMARGTARPIEAAVAADGIDEIFVMMAARGERHGGEGQTLHLHGTDRGDEWLLTLQSDRVEVEHRHAKADMALRGAESDLELLLYQRPALGPVERFGDPGVLDAWYRAFTFG